MNGGGDDEDGACQCNDLENAHTELLWYRGMLFAALPGGGEILQGLEKVGARLVVR